MSVLRLQNLAKIETNSVDIAYTSAVLQHIPPEFIPDILANMIRISRKHVVFWELDEQLAVSCPQGFDF